MFRTFMIVLGVVVVAGAGSMIYMGPAQVLEFVGGFVTTDNRVDAGSGNDAAAPEAIPATQPQRDYNKVYESN